MSEERVGEPIRDNRTARTFAGLLLAPVAGGLGSPLIVSLVICVIDFINRGFDWHAFEVMSSLGQFTFYFLIYAALFGIPISLAIGTLAYLALRRRGLNGFVVYLVGGATIGMVGAMSVSALAGLGVGLVVVAAPRCEHDGCREQQCRPHQRPAPALRLHRLVRSGISD